MMFGAFLLTATSFAQTPPPAADAAPAAAVAAPEVKPAHHEHEKHPELRKALRKLRGAKQDLEKAAHDFGGHKAKALEAINTAIEEIKSALESDKK